MKSPSVLTRNIQAARKSFQPLFGTLEITQKCNLRCKHCYNFDRSTPYASQNELTLNEIYKALDALADLGVLSLNISGGEPLLHPDLFDILDYAQSHHFHLRIKSNGTLITKDLAKKLRTHGVKEIDISLYGANEDSYISFSQKKGFSKTIQSIRFCKEAGLPVNTSIILHRGNYTELAEMIRILEEIGVQYFVSDEITDRYDGTEAKTDLALQEEDYLILLKGPHRHFFAHENADKNVMCGCAKSVIGIDAHGEVYPCIGAPLPCGNIRHQELRKIWDESPTLKRIRALEFKDFDECSKCSLITKCSRSSGSAYINTKKYTGCDPTALTYARARSKSEP